jgi:signal peptidase I
MIDLRGWGRRALRWTEHFLALIGLFFVIYVVGFDLSPMISPSMAPTLQCGDWILTEKISRRFFNPDRWEVLTFRDKEGMQLMKRVVGLPGETVAIPDVGRLVINGTPMKAPSDLQYLPAGNVVNAKTVEVGEGWYVLGDEVRDSLDSRFEGPVPRPRVVGRAWLRLWPPSRFGLVR